MEYKKIKDIADINPENITNNMKFEYINYLDTSNITKGKINDIIKIDYKDAPSRAKRIVKVNDIIYSSVRPNLCHYGILRNVYENMIVSTGFIVLRCKENVLPEYLYAYITLPKITKKMNLIAITSTSAYPSIKPDDLANLEIPLPSLKKQEQISKILSNIDKKIELNNQISDNLQKLSQELYKRWFVDFEFPNEEGKPYKSSGGKMVDSELGKIPEKWEIGNFNDGILTKIISSGIRKYEGVKKYVATADVEGTSINNYSKVTYDKRPSRANMQPIKNSVWFAKMQGSKKNIIIADYMIDLLNDYIFSTGFMGIECLNDSINYIWNVINDDRFVIKKDNFSTGTLMAGVNNNTIINFKYLIPSHIVLLKYDTIINPINLYIYNLNMENQKLINLRDLLLPKLLNGEIDLEKIEI